MTNYYHSPIEGMRLCALCGADTSEEQYQRTYKKYLVPMCYNCTYKEILKGLNESKIKKEN